MPKIVVGWKPEEISEEAIYRETQRIKVRVSKKRFGKLMTEIEGFDQAIDLEDLAKTLKKRLACGGTVKDGKILLQGDHRAKIKQVLAELGFSEDQIDIIEKE